VPVKEIPWAALSTDISTEFETGHWESCGTLTDPIANEDPGDTGGAYNDCTGGPYENAGPADDTTPELGDAVCYFQGDTHPGYDGPGTSTQPDEATGCQDNEFQNGDLDFDGQPYWTEWPTSTHTSLYPASFQEAFPTTNGRQYSQYFFQTDIALSESTCTPSTLSGCTVPPQGPGGFYPYWSSQDLGIFGGCTLFFGNVSGILIANNGKDAEYGTNQFATLGYPEFEGSLINNPCATNPIL
jgi:hypothetical protein